MSRRARISWSAVALCAASVTLSSPLGHAANKPKVLVLPYQHLEEGLPDDLGEQTTVVVTKEIAHGDVSVIQAEDVGEAQAPKGAAKPSDAPTGDPGAGAKAEEAIAKARELMEDSDFEKAAKQLERAIKLLEDNGDAVPDLRLLSEAYLQAGVAYFRDGQEEQGDDMLNKAVHLAPDRQLDPSDYPPIFIRVYERARFNVLRRPRARIEVKATPGAQVLFDGRNMGKAPIALEDALPGVHWIRVERPGDPVRVKKLNIPSKQTTVVEFAGAPGSEAEEPSAVGVLAALAANQVGEEHVAQLQAAGKKAGADLVMFGAIYKSDTAYNIRTAYLRVKDGSVGRLQDIAFDLDMLTAEIEVYKLADDATSQAKSGQLSEPVKERPFAIAAGYQKRVKRKAVAQGAKEVRMSTAVAAPPPIKAPQSLHAQGGEAGVRAPVGEAGAVTAAGGAVVKPTPTLVPKDEMSASAPKADPALTFGTTIPKDEKKGGEDPSTWWIWVIVGVAAAGAAGAGGYFLFSGGASDEGSLRISW